MKTQDYLQGLESWRIESDGKRRLYDKFTMWVTSCPNISIFQADLLTGKTGKQMEEGGELELQFSLDDISSLVDAGFLRKRRDTTSNDIYWFSHPQVCLSN